MQYERQHQQAQTIIDEAVREVKGISYEFPIAAIFYTSEYFREAFSEISDSIIFEKKGLSPNNDLSKKYMLQRFLADTLTLSGDRFCIRALCRCSKNNRIAISVDIARKR